MEVRFFDKNLERFIQTLEKPTIAKVLRAVDLLAEFEHRLNMPHSKHLWGRLFELRIKGQQEVRIIYAFHGGTALLLHGF
ncbi:MAG: type II toxin-antitoxin system RelE/ParE family toxin [Patescibacteria group bacterium]